MKDIILEHLDGDDISNDFRRALLTVGDNEYYTFWRRSAHIPDGYIPYGPLMDKPQYCLITAGHKEKDGGDIRSYAASEKLHYLKTLLLDLLSGGKTLDKIIKQFHCPSGMPQWKRLLIKDGTWLDGNNARFLVIDGDHAFLRHRKKSWYPVEIA